MQEQINALPAPGTEGGLVYSPRPEALSQVPPAPKTEKHLSGKADQEDKGNRKGASQASRAAPAKIKELVEETQARFAQLDIRVELRVDPDTDQPTVRVLHRETGELIRQIPPDLLLRVHKKLDELRGVLFDETA